MKTRQAGRLLRRFAKSSFGLWQALGLHITANHFYEPVPDTRSLPEELWKRRESVPGVELDAAQQAALTMEAAEFAREFDALRQNEYPADNPSLTPADAAMYYGLLRLRKPARVLEVGAGFSTQLALAALKRNRQESHSGQLTTIEPYPLPFVSKLPDIVLKKIPLQRIVLADFLALTKGDILFIDSSHVVATGSDVQREVLEILPQLAVGVLVHFHDIFIPNEYPREWIIDRKRFWTEQYLLQAFLAFNNCFAVRWAGNYLQQVRPTVAKQLTKQHDPSKHVLGSFWLERVG
ncbi:MAG: class I SAM-dependent methyltransferase [Parcubacteria group bacterium]